MELNTSETPADDHGIPADLLEGLNAEQRRAVISLDGPVAVIAGPGSGKTRVLTRRVAALVRSGRCGSGRVLAVTFTNKAAGEMKERLAHLLGEETAGQLWVATFHSFCAKFLRYEAEAAGLPRAFSIIDTSDGRSIMREVHRDLSLPDDAAEVKASLALVSRIKNGGRTNPNPTALRVMSAYQERLSRLGALDFDDLLLRTKEVLESDPGVRQRWQRRFAYVLVDEYQDTNPVQYAIVGMLSGEHRNLCVVGDADQAIYGFRSATPAALIGFTQQWADATVVVLEENYRSTPEILAVCQTIIDGNEATIRPQLRTSNPSGDPVRLLTAADDREESRFIATEIARRGTAGTTAVLVRTNAQTRSIENALMQEGLPYSVVGTLRFYERAEVKDALSYLKVAANPKDMLSLARAASVPKRGIGPKALEQIADASTGGDVLSAIELKLADGSITRNRDGWSDLLKTIRAVQAGMQTGGPRGAVKAALDGGVRLHHQNATDDRRQERLDNLAELENAAVEFDIVNRGRVDENGVIMDPTRLSEAFLEHIALITSVDDVESADGAVQILTAHASKGKEFGEVYVIGVEENVFPHSRGGEIADESEERRLLFVACSRAEKRLTMTTAEKRLTHGKITENQLSRFLAGTERLLETRRIGAPSSTVGRNWHAANRAATWGTPAVRRDAKPVTAPGPRLDPTHAQVGTKVMHNTFGHGIITELNQEARTVTVRFDGAVRQLSLDLAPLKAV